MAELYVGTDNGVQTIGGGGIIPKGRVVLTEARTTSTYNETSEYQSDELIGKSVIDVNIRYGTSMSANDKTLRVYADCSEGHYHASSSGGYNAISVEYISSTGTVKLQAFIRSSDVAYKGRVTAFYFE